MINKSDVFAFGLMNTDIRIFRNALILSVNHTETRILDVAKELVNSPSLLIVTADIDENNLEMFVWLGYQTVNKGTQVFNRRPEDNGNHADERLLCALPSLT